MKAARGLILTLLCVVCVLRVTVASAGALPASFGTEGTGAGEFVEARGIAVDQETGDVYVADNANNRIDKFGPEGEFLLAWGWGVADGKTEALQTCTTTCFAGLPGSGAGQFNGAEGIAVDSSLGFSHGDVYVADTRNERIEKFGPNGEFLLQFGSEGTAPGEFQGLQKHAVAVDPTTGVVYVADNSRVQLFNEAGEVQSQIAIPGGGASENLAVDSTGDFYLKSHELRGVHKYDPAGKELPPPRDEAGHGESEAFTIGPGDELFLNDKAAGESHHIFAFDAAGVQTASFDAGGAAQDAGRGIAFSEHTGALYLINFAGPETSVRIVTPPPLGPLVTGGSAGKIEPTTATLEGSVNPEGAVTEYHFEYGTTAAYGQSTPVSTLDAVNEVQSVTVAATGGAFTLAFKGEATAEIPFNATAAEVQGALEAIPALGAGQVAVSGEPGGPWSVEFTSTRAGQDVPELAVEAGGLTGEAPSATVTTTTPGVSLFDDRPVSAPLTALLPDTVYHFRLLATDGSHTTEGPDETFTTLPPVSIDATSVSEVDDKSARLEAELNPHGLASEYHFEYDTIPYAEGEPGHGTPVPAQDANIGPETGDVAVSETIQGLTPSTVYHYRVVAQNTLGTSVGPDRTFTTQGASAALPDGRSYELVSPPNKHGAPLEPITEEGGLIQAAPGGGAFAYVAIGPLGEQSKGARSPEDSQLLSRRGPDGWTTEDITTPHEEISVIHVGQLSEYQFFAEDLSAGVVEPVGATPLSAQATERTPYRREADGRFVPLVSAANVPAGTKFGGEVKAGEGSWQNGVRFVTATPDLSHIVLSSHNVLAPGFVEGFASPNTSLYELSGGALQLISVLPNEKPAVEEGLGVGVGANNQDLRGAISADGGRVFFEAGGGPSAELYTGLYMRDTTLAKTLRLDVAAPGAAGGNPDAVFQGASENGSRVFFTDTAQLTAHSRARVNRPDLYMCEIGRSAGQPTCVLSDLTVAVNPGETANVLKSVSAIDQTGTHVYFAASGVLTNTPNAEGQRAVPGAANMYEYDTSTRQVQLVAVLSETEDQPDWGGSSITELSSLTARSSPDGGYFTFMSQNSLTGYDNRDVHSGQPDEEVYLFDAGNGMLRCVSCDPSGARPVGVLDPSSSVIPQLLVDHRRTWHDRWLAGSIPGWTAQEVNRAPYQSRFLSDSGRTFFNSSDALVPQDANKLEDVYEYEPPGVGSCSSSSSTFSSASGGCVNLISSGESKEESAFLDASEDGAEVFFLTASRLAANDVDSAFDVYDAHVCTGASPCPALPSSVAGCEGDTCQNPSSPPGEQTPASLSYSGPGNAPPAAGTPPAKPKAKPTRAQLLSKALKACEKKRQRSKRLACEKQARKRYTTTAKKSNFKTKRDNHERKAGH